MISDVKKWSQCDILEEARKDLEHVILQMENDGRDPVAYHLVQMYSVSEPIMWGNHPTDKTILAV